MTCLRCYRLDGVAAQVNVAGRLLCTPKAWVGAARTKQRQLGKRISVFLGAILQSPCVVHAI
jgi:hypothetical protein